MLAILFVKTHKLTPEQIAEVETGRLRARLNLECDTASRREARLHQKIGEARALLDDVICGSVNARPYPDGPNLDRELRERIKAYLSGPNIKGSRAEERE